MASQLSHLTAETQRLIETGNPDEALNLLSNYSEDVNYINNPEYLNLLGNVLLETSNVDQAYAIYLKSIELDPQGKFSIDGYYNLGQIIGNQEGLNYLIIGQNILEKELNSNKNQNNEFIKKKILQGMFSQIEIWMTDLCMEPEAEIKCQEIITNAVNIDPLNPETWSLLASIKISQQNSKEAKDHIKKSWELFQNKKLRLENSGDNIENNSEDANDEYIDMIQPMITLARYAIEVGLYDTAIEITNNIHDISDDLLEPYYLEAFANVLAAKTLQYRVSNSSDNKSYELPTFEVINDLKLSIDSDGNGINEEITEYTNNGLICLSQANKVLYLDETSDDEIKQQIKNLIEELGGKPSLKRIEKLVKNNSSKVNEDNWENEIAS